MCRQRILAPALDPAFALHTERQPFHSSEILEAMQRYVNGQTWRLLGITERDLYIPILTFVFGEAQMGSSSAVVPPARAGFLRPATDLDLLANRLLIESVHELGHTLQLTHCDDFRCATAPSQAIEWIDIKDSGFCEDCLAKATQAV